MENNNSITVDQLLYAYATGYFPMAELDGEIQWYAPDPRAIIPIATYKPAKSLRPVLAKGLFEIRINQAFEAVMRNCAAPRGGDSDTWISEEIIQVYTELHQLGFAHSVEAYIDNTLVGGLYGVQLGAAFFGESMFTHVSNASKVAFHTLIQILQTQGFELLDSQFMNDNVKRYGAIEISRERYETALEAALKTPCTFVLTA